MATNFVSIFLKYVKEASQVSSDPAEYMGLCPFHDDHNPSFSFNVKKGIWHCFGCEKDKAYGGNAEGFIEALYKEGLIDEEEARRLLGLIGASGDWLDEEEETEKGEVPKDWWEKKKEVYPYRDEKGNEIAMKVRIKDEYANGKRFIWVHEKDGKEYFGRGKENPSLYNLHLLYQYKDRPVIITEGEKDADTLIGVLQTQMIPISGDGGARTWKDEWNKHLRGRDVIIVYDNDEPGIIGAKKVANSLHKVAKSVRICWWDGVELPEGKKDITDYYEYLEEKNGKDNREKTREEIKKFIEKAEEYMPIPGEPQQEGRKIAIISQEELMQKEYREQTFLVENILPLSGVLAIVGDVGVGKTWLSLFLAQSVASGTPFLGRFQTTPGNVLFVDEENGERRIQMRLKRMKANSLPIYYSILQNIKLNKGAQDWILLLNEIKEKDIKLIIFDSLIRIHTGDENKAQDMSRLFDVFNYIRGETETTIVFTHHLRKTSLFKPQNAPIERVRGSTDIIAYPDSILAMIKNDNYIGLHQAKNRDGNPITPLALRIVDNADETKIEVVAEIKEEVSQIREAQEIIKELLKDGTKYRKNLLKEAQARGVKPATFTRAIQELIDTGEVKKEKNGLLVFYELIE